MEEIVRESTALVWFERSQNINELATALSKAQAVIENAAKDKENPFFKSQYADLASVWGVARKPLTDNGLSVIQEPSSREGKVLVTTTLLHSSGQYIRSSFEVPVAKQDAQGYGSAVTYLRRYALQSFIGIAPAEDDGNDASKPNPGVQAGQGSKKTTAPKDTPPPADNLPWNGEATIRLNNKTMKWKDISGENLEYLRHHGSASGQGMAEREASRRDEALEAGE